MGRGFLREGSEANPPPPSPSVDPLPTCDRPHVGDHTTHVRILRRVTGMLTGCRASEGMVAVSCVLLLTALTGCVAMPHHGRIGPTVMRDRVATMGDQLSYLRPRTWRRHDNRRCIDRLPRLNPLNFRPQPPPRYSNPKWNAVWSRTKEGRSKIAERKAAKAMRQGTEDPGNKVAVLSGRAPATHKMRSPYKGGSTPVGWAQGDLPKAARRKR